MSHHWVKTSSDSRGFGIAGVLLLLAAIGVVLLLTMWSGEQKREARQQFHAEQTDPRDMLARLFIETTKFQEAGREADWKKILALMSSEDQTWLESNRLTLASMNPLLQGRDAFALNENEQRFHALSTLLGLNTTTERPIIVQFAADANDRYGVAYVHPPNRIQELREIFLINETGEWKVRRFLGTRDDLPFLTRLVAAKRNAGRELFADEREFEANPQAYVDKMRAQLLAEAGQKPI